MYLASPKKKPFLSQWNRMQFRIPGNRMLPREPILTSATMHTKLFRLSTFPEEVPEIIFFPLPSVWFRLVGFVHKQSATSLHALHWKGIPQIASSTSRGLEQFDNTFVFCHIEENLCVELKTLPRGRNLLQITPCVPVYHHQDVIS